MGFLAKLIAYKVARFGRDTTGTLSTSVDLSKVGGTVYGPKDCRGAVAFTAASGAVAGGWAQLTLIADGTNTPSFPAAWKAAYGSQSWTSTAGVVHVVTVWYDGFYYWYSIAPGASTVYGLTLHSLYVDGTSLVMSSNIAMSTAATPSASCFTVTADGVAVAVSSVSITANYIILTLATPVTYGQTVTLTIDRDGTNYPRASTDSGKIAVPVSGASVTNYTDAAAPATIPNYTFLNKSANFKDFAATGHPWECGVSSASGSWESGRMQSPAGASVSAASGVDCWVEFTYRSTDRAPAVCMHSAPGHADPGSATIYVGVSPVTGKIRHYIYLAGAWSDTTVTATEGMRIRARRNTSNAWQVEYSTNGGASWSVAAADVASGSSTQYPKGAVFGILTDTTFRARYSGFS